MFLMFSSYSNQTAVTDWHVGFNGLNEGVPVTVVLTQGHLLQRQLAYLLNSIIISHLHASILFYIKWVTPENMKYLEIALNTNSCSCSKLL